MRADTNKVLVHGPSSLTDAVYFVLRHLVSSLAVAPIPWWGSRYVSLSDVEASTNCASAKSEALRQGRMCHEASHVALYIFGNTKLVKPSTDQPATYACNAIG